VTEFGAHPGPRANPGPLADVMYPLDGRGKVCDQVVRAVVAAIAAGRLRVSRRAPDVGVLARHYRISRWTVRHAYQALVDGGVLVYSRDIRRYMVARAPEKILFGAVAPHM